MASPPRKAPRLAPDGSVRIVPSLLAADFADLRGSLAALDGTGLEWVSVDVMDGHFVPNLSFGPDLIPALRRASPAAIDSHLMVEEPGRFGPVFAEAGSDWVTVHIEACPEPRPLIRRLRELGAGAGLAVKPATPAEALLPFLGEVDLVLVMTVEPGFGGQRFLPDMLGKVRALRQAIDKARAPVWLQVDGGVNAETGELAAAAGADSLVAGSSVFKAPDPAAALREIEARARRAFVARR